MVIGIGKITMGLSDCHSLKDKRKIVKSLIARVQNAFNASVAEIGLNDVHQRAEIGIAMVGNDRRLINSKMDQVFEFADTLQLAEIIDSEMEIINI